MDKARRALFRGRFASKKAAETQVIHMPWALSDDVFLDQCTRCNKCAEACPEQVIVKGDGGFPTVDFNQGECTFCGDCVTVCPEPIFNDQSESPWDLIAEITDASQHQSVSLDGVCMVQKGIVCQSCKDVCDVRAINMKYNQASMPEPVINNDVCNGCGACVSTCPTAAIHMISMPGQPTTSKGENASYAIA